ncbi:MAG: SRPBCC domain-containing protein [Acidobacteriota bacterium]
MARNYTVQTRILRPVADVFDAIVSGDKLCNYFTDRSSGDLVQGKKVFWHWSHYEPELPVRVDEIVANRLIVLTLDSAEWKKTLDESYPVRVIFEFAELEDGGTMLSISEEGWKTDADGLKGSHDNCGGWTHMAMCLKAWLEHGIDLR